MEYFLLKTTSQSDFESKGAAAKYTVNQLIFMIFVKSRILRK